MWASLPAGENWESTLPKLPSLEEIRAALTDRTRRPRIEELYKCIFCLRQQSDVASQAIDALIESLQAFPPTPGALDTDLRSSSVLFRHECCYLLGQIGADSTDMHSVKKPAFVALLKVLEDEREDVVTRHEAAEGIAAVFNHNIDDSTCTTEELEQFDQELLEISSNYSASEETLGDEATLLSEVRQHNASADTHTQPGSDTDAAARMAEEERHASLFLKRNRRLMAILKRHVAEHGRSPLGETCYVALEGLKRQRAKVCACQYRTFDPAIGDPSAGPQDITRYLGVLADAEEELYQRYTAMFTLRNLNAAAELAQVSVRQAGRW